MRVHVAFTPAEAAATPIGVVVDVLRATSTIAQALASGCRRVLCEEIDDARRLRRTIVLDVGPRLSRMVDGAAESAL